MQKLSLKVKLIVAFLMAGLLPMLAVAIYSYGKSSSALENEALKKLVAVRNIKGSAVKRYFEGIRDQVQTFSHDVMVEDAMQAFTESFKEYTNEANVSSTDEIVFRDKLKSFYVDQFSAKYKKENGIDIDSVKLLDQVKGNELALQYHYIANNSNPLGSKEVLDYANDGTSYSKLHAKYHPSIREYLQKFGYYDIFLVDIDSGNIVYSVFKELDYATSLLTGPYRDTNFADAFRKARDLNDKKSFVIVDYKKYTPSFEAPASFIASPIWSGSKKVGVAIFQMPIERLNAIMGQRSGMGETGETYLFGKDKLMRSDSYLDSENYNVVSSFKNPSSGTLKSSTVDLALGGSNGHLTTTNYLGKEVLSAYTPIDILGLKWGLISEMSSDEAFLAANSLKNTLFIMLIISCITIALFAFFLSSNLVNTIKAIANRLLESIRDVTQSSNRISDSSQQLSDSAVEAASSLQETVSSIDEISSMVQRNADSAGSSTQVSLKSSEAASSGKSTVESMIKSINEISSSNDEIAKEMQKNNTDISKIVAVISEIGEKTKVINDIVFQTKLLSFNASVEAARAGEHGKGFAVVAEEVGNLAAMSGKAALEITEMLDSSIKQVTGIVDSTKRKVEVLVTTSKEKVEVGNKTAHECGESLDKILDNVSTVNEMVREIASASNEQSIGVQEVTRAMQQLDQTTHKNTTVAQESSEMATRLKEQADGLSKVALDLMEVVNGVGSLGNSHFAHKGQYHSPEGENGVVIDLPERKKHGAESSTLKVSGLDTEIPNGSTGRFEDL